MSPKGAYSGYLACPMCDVEVPIDDESVGEQVYCPYCQTPLVLRKKRGREEDEEVYLEEDF